MAWARIDDGFHDHPKVDSLTLSAVGLWTLCLSHAHRHRKTAVVPGHISEARVRKLAGRQAHPLVTELLAAGLWEQEPGLGGWVIHDFADYLPKERDPDERREAGRRGALSRWQSDSKPDGKLPSDGMASDSSRASAPASPSRPVPSLDGSSKGGRTETPPAANATEPPNDETCTRHPNGNPGNDACRGCQRVEQRITRRIERDAETSRRDAEARALACIRCDGTNVVDPDTKAPTRRKCDHRPAA